MTLAVLNTVTLVLNLGIIVIGLGFLIYLWWKNKFDTQLEDYVKDQMCQMRENEAKWRKQNVD